VVKNKYRSRSRLPFASLRPFSATKRARPFSAKKDIRSLLATSIEGRLDETKKQQVITSRWKAVDVEEYKWTALERHMNNVHLKYTEPTAFCARAAFLPPVTESSTQTKEVTEMASLKVEIAKRKMEVQAKQLMLFMANSMLEKNCAQLGITDPVERKKLFDRIFKMLKEQNPVDRCVSACCDDDMGSVINFYKQVFEIYCRKESFRRLLERIEAVAKEMKGTLSKKAR
jgi:hypothetical protein